LADLQYQSAVQQMFENRPQALMNINSARDNYQRLLSDSTDDRMKARATLGLARCFEALGQLEAAKLEYESFVTRYPNDVFVGEAKSRIADLGRASTKEFYAWFSKQDIKPEADAEPGVPGRRPNFDLRTLPAEGPVFTDPADGSLGGMPSGTGAPTGGQAAPTGSTLVPPTSSPTVTFSPTTPAADEKKDSAAPAATPGAPPQEKSAADKAPVDEKAPAKDAPAAEPK
jgi:hypothetical protein